MIEFVVAGVPAPQGSKVRTRWGMREDNPNTRPWREAVAWAATAAMTGADPNGQSRVLEIRPPLDGPLELTATFYFPRPKSHYRTGKNAGSLKESAPLFCETKPDADKLLRAVGDAITGVICRDDSQLVRVEARKVYGSPRAVVTVKRVCRECGEGYVNRGAHMEACTGALPRKPAAPPADPSNHST